MLALLKPIFYTPLYNGLIFLMGVLPNAGVAVILLTLLVKIALFPLSQKASRLQFLMKKYEGEINEIKAKHGKDKQAQGKAILDFYREKKLNPFAGFLSVLIQIPLVISLYYIFYGGGLPQVDSALLYSFVHIPEVNMHFLGVDIGGKNMLLAILAGVTQYLQAHALSVPLKPRGENATMGEDLARSMQLQMKYLLPVFIVFVAYASSGAVALYLITSNLFAAVQELYLRRQLSSVKSKSEIPVIS